MSRDIELLTYATIRARDAELIRARKDVLLAELRRAALARYPRPDLVADSPHWCRLLGLAYDQDGDDGNGVFGALHGIRCMGARLIRKGAGWVIRGEYDGYDADRRNWLLPHRAPLTQLLTELGRDDMAAPPPPAIELAPCDMCESCATCPTASARATIDGKAATM